MLTSNMDKYQLWSPFQVDCQSHGHLVPHEDVLHGHFNLILSTGEQPLKHGIWVHNAMLSSTNLLKVITMLKDCTIIPWNVPAREENMNMRSPGQHWNTDNKAVM